MNLFLKLSIRTVLVAVVFLCLAGCSKEAQQARSMERARGFLEAGEHEKAKLEYMSVVRKHRNNGEALAQIGLIWSLQGASNQALPYLRRARELGKLPDELRPRLMLALAHSNQVAAAREEALEILKRDPVNAPALLFLSDTSRKPEEVDVFRQVMDKLPDRDWAGYHAAMVPLLLRAGRVIEAEEAATKAMALDPKSMEAHLVAGAVCQTNKDASGMEAAYRAVFDLAPVRSHDRLRLAELKKNQGNLDEARALVSAVIEAAPDFLPALLFSAEIAFTAKAYEEALATLEKVFAIETSNFPARFLQSDIMSAKGEPKQSVEIMQRLDRFSNGAPRVRIKLARSLMTTGQYAEAIDLLNKLLIKTPDREASLLLAEAQLKLGNPAAVIPAMQAQLEKEPNDEASAVMMARGLEGQRRFEEALRIINKLIEVRPGNALYHAMAGNALLQMKQIPEARKEFEQSLALAPDDESVWMRLLELDLADGKNDEAMLRAMERRKRQPQSASAAFTQAQVHLVRKEWEPAETALFETLKLDPSHPTAHETLSTLYSTTGRMPEAIAKIQDRLSIEPKDPRALRHLALLQTQHKEYDKAAETYEQLAASLPNPEPLVLNNLANLYENHLDNPAKAYELARQARSLRPAVDADSSLVARLEAASIADTLGFILYRRGKFAEAYPLLQEAASVLSDHPEVQAHLGLTAAAMAQTQVAREALGKAVAWKDDFPTKAEAQQRLALLDGTGTSGLTGAELTAMAAETPNDPLLQLRLAEALESENKLPEAAVAYHAALKLNPELSSAALKLGQLYAGPLNDPVKAMEFATEARKLAPNDATTAGLLGELAYGKGEHAWAYDLLHEATLAGVKGAETLFMLGRAAYSVGRIDAARDAMTQAVAASPKPATAAEATTFLELTATPPPPATMAEEILKNEPASVPALMVRAGAQFKAGEADAATATYKEILNIYPAFAPAQKQLAAVLARVPATRGQAYDLAMKARELLPDDPDLAETLAILTYHRKNYQYAADLFSDAARVRPPQAEALYYLGMAQLALKQEEAGKDSLSKAVAAGLSGPEAADAARILQPSPQ